MNSMPWFSPYSTPWLHYLKTPRLKTCKNGLLPQYPDTTTRNITFPLAPVCRFMPLPDRIWIVSRKFPDPYRKFPSKQSAPGKIMGRHSAAPFYTPRQTARLD